MVVFLFFIVCFILLMAFPLIRIILFHPFKTLLYPLKDVYRYVHDRTFNVYDGGLLNCYFAHFGGGKTLSVTHYVCHLFRRYNNKKVWDRGQKKYVTQKVHVISNVQLNGIPFEELQSLSQVVCCAWKNKKIDLEQGTRTVVIVLLDEASSQLNSRNFKSNIDPDFLNTLITSRHFHMSLFYTSQKFKLVDALLRSVTQRAIWCKKHWRFMLQYVYSADELELASDPRMIQPIAKGGFFISDRDYNAYDTLATVDKLKKSVEVGDMMTEEQILAMRNAQNPDNDGVVKPSRILRKARRKGA
ncbi:MAG: hypothetical protein IJU80_06645 [Lachnospiraceae bacterium]|nr:hypothetical protein [Lachnospiraceae bacterium]